MNLAPVFQLWKETRVPGETPHKHEENRQTPHRKPSAKQRDFSESHSKPHVCWPEFIHFFQSFTLNTGYVFLNLDYIGEIE